MSELESMLFLTSLEVAIVNVIVTVVAEDVHSLFSLADTYEV